jgi:hypothetical protein
MPSMTLEEYERGMAETREEGDRAAAIVAAAILESLLEDCIVARLLPMSNTHRESLLGGGDSSFATFSAKINLGFSLGLFGPKGKNDLTYIRKIRNEFAHYPGRDFSHPEISKLCLLLTNYVTDLGDEVRQFHDANPEINLRWRYLYAAHEIGYGMLKETRLHHATPPAPTVLP